MAQVAYIRVSSVEQNTARQLADCNFDFDRVFEDKVSGGSVERPALRQLIEYVREGDTIHVHSIDRLARSLDDLRQLVANWNNKGITVHFHKESLIFSTDDNSPMAELMLNMLGAVAQFERSMIRERQREGIAKAKQNGKYQGRKANTERNATIVSLRETGKSIRTIADELGCNPSTVQRVIKSLKQA